MATYRERNGKVQVQVRIKNKQVIVHQESATFDNKAQATAWAKAVEKRIAEQGVSGRKESLVTLADVFDGHVEMLKKAGRPHGAHEHRFNNIKKYPFVNKPATEVTSKDFIDWAIAHSAGRSPATLLNHLMGVRSAYRAAPTAQDIPLQTNVIADAITHLRLMRVVATSEQRDRRVSDAELSSIELWWNEQKGTLIPLPTILRFLVALPRRRDEVMAMEWARYDPKEHVITLVDTKHPTKTRIEKIPVPPEAEKVLAGLPRNDARIFPYIGDSVSSAFQRATHMLGIEDITLHDLRHEGISRLFEAGLDIPEVSMISGHLSWQTLKRYTHLKPKHVLDKLKERKARKAA
jgi:integrase